jgi:recombination protein RecT
MSSQTVSQAVAQRDTTPGALIKQYSTSFASVLPTHVKPETWVRLAQGALKKGKRVEAPNPKDPNHHNHGRFELELAAANDPGKFLAALLDAAQLGLTPGTEQYYLTPRKVKGRLEILGITGYQGHIELMYRAGAVSAIIAEVVRENDEYRYQRGIDEVPIHRYKPFAREADRGPLIGTYAYARMKDGSVSRVVELNADDIARIKESSQGSSSEYSPWVRHEAAMWLKSGVRQLQKWVPTSPEFRQEQARAAGEAQRVASQVGEPVAQAVEDYRSGALEGEIAEDAPSEDWPEPAPIPGGETE